MNDERDIYFDVQGLSNELVSHVTELVARISAGVFLVWISWHELRDELNTYRLMRRTPRG